MNRLASHGFSRSRSGSRGHDVLATESPGLFYSWGCKGGWSWCIIIHPMRPCNIVNNDSGPEGLEQRMNGPCKPL